MNICVYGAASETIDNRFKEVGNQLGRYLAKQGHTLIFGGGNKGLMGAVVRGVQAEGGVSYGISPEFFRPDGMLYEECTKLFQTADMRSRKSMLEVMSDGFIITPGGTGTYDEFFEIFTLKRLGRTKKPIVILNTLGYYEPLLELLRHTARLGFMSEGYIDSLLYVTESIEDAVDYIVKNQ